MTKRKSERAAATARPVHGDQLNSTSENLPQNSSTPTNTLSADDKNQRRLERRSRRRRSSTLALSSEDPFTLSDLESALPSRQQLMSSRTVAQTRIPLLIISLGNPGKGGLTYHDAGHGALSILRRQRVPENWTLWASPTYMNVSGPAVKKQWNNWAGRRDGGMLVVLQDELEMEFGQVRKRAGWSSAKGHNGIKSIQQVLPRDTEWWRLAIGIGRPESRDTDSVSNFVLSKIPRREMQVLENKGDDLMELLMEITE